MSTETVNQQVPAGTWSVDPVHSGLHFAITHNGIATFRSGFNEYAATLTGGESPRLEGNVEVASIDIDEEMLKGHLLSPDFFDAEKFPQLKFRSTELSVEDDGTARLSGELEIHGETREVSAVGRFAQLGADLGGSERVGFSFETALDRREFGLNWNAELPSGGDVLEWEVAINVELELVAQES
ncbi:MAG TPA: YceI family protein [Solirubrobacterales bacterium]|nr:YceI family protein [Solirubrobacterales bacterium]